MAAHLVPFCWTRRAVRVRLEVAGDHSMKKTEATAYYKVFLLLAC